MALPRGAFLMPILLALVACIAVDPPRPKGVPAEAQCQIVSPTVRIYHWTLPHDEAGKRKVMIYPVVDEWPKGVWGAEVTVTPIPFCCGATRTYFSWISTDRIEPRWAGTVRVGSSYRLDFRFK